MTEREIYDGVIMNGTTDFIFVVEVLRRHDARWCVIGGLAVSAVQTIFLVPACYFLIHGRKGSRQPAAPLQPQGTAATA